MSKKIMLSGYYGFENLGDELILHVVTQMLKSFGFEPVVLSENPDSTSKTYDVESIERGNIFAILSAMKNVKGFISGGGGLFQDSTGYGSPLYYGGLIEAAHWKKLPVAFFGQGIGPLKSSLGRFITAHSIHRSSLVVVRDVKSQAWATRIASKKSELMADPVWLWQPDLKLKSLNQNGLAVSLRSWPDLHNSDIDIIAECICNLPTIQDVGVNLIDFQSGVDIVPLAKLEQMLKNKNIPCRWFSGINAVSGISQSSALLGMRYHSILVAAQIGIPIISISYDPKVQILAAQLKIKDFALNCLDTFTADQFKHSLAYADNETIQSFQKSAFKGFSLLKSWLEDI